MKKEDAEEFTQSLGQIVGGSWRQIHLAKRLGVPKALGLSLTDWVNGRLGGYMRMAIEERREAVKNLTADGESLRDTAEILGVSHQTVANTVKNLTAGNGQASLALAEVWTEEESARRADAEKGGTAVANQKTDERLIRWAQSQGRLVKIDRSTDWGNPFVMPEDGDRDTVCEHYGIYLSMKPSLQRRLSDLRGKVLVCWCYPDRCHGDYLAELAQQS